ncbi:uncharacterized protein SCHCODRAFT_02607028 [Schizophyllum commune H4-8]|uniref:uncharacterized protein n=1 Tax=Schizophyllum commune (strain H4-8 / FGSC 9210) TaxID=578458 RepID=UPI00215F1C1F|nr:uncharacterized protein SCHCODRAFT_02607028 [Schizophyllum commune H4-8]KAI5900113.1 hypothetical protein SCHCODRAFT_02607028 [Schizophyllum commune H4-8]
MLAGPQTATSAHRSAPSSSRPKIAFATGTKVTSGKAPRGIPTPDAVQQRATLPPEAQHNSIYCIRCAVPHFYVPKPIPIIITNPYDADENMIERLEGVPCLRRQINILHIALPSDLRDQIPDALRAARRLVEARVGRYEEQRLLPNLRKVVYHGSWSDAYRAPAAIRAVERLYAREEDVPDDGSIHSEEALERPSHACVVEMRGHFVHRNGVGFECIKTDMP